jgi:hypothetical protein
LSVALGLHKSDVIWGAACSGVLVTLIPLRFSALLSGFGVFLVVGAVLAVVTSGLVLLDADRVNNSQTLFGDMNVYGVPIVMGGVALAVADHPVFPDVYATAQDKDTFKKGLVIGFLIFLAIAISLCIFAYLPFGIDLHPVVLTNIGKDSHGERVKSIPPWLSMACNAALSVRCIQTLPAFLRPCVAVLREILKCVSCQILNLSGPEKMETELSLLIPQPLKFFGRMMLTVFVYTICAFCADLLSGLLMEITTLMGAFFKSLNAFILPCMSYAIICRKQMQSKPVRRCLVIIILMIGVSYGVLGTFSAIMSIMSISNKR